MTDGNLEGVVAFTTEQLAAKPERADVLQDLLAFLVEQMTALIREKSATAKQFVPALKDFHGIDAHALKPKTKLDEFWKLEVPEVFAHFRANKLRLTICDNGRNPRPFQENQRSAHPRWKGKSLSPTR